MKRQRARRQYQRVASYRGRRSSGATGRLTAAALCAAAGTALVLARLWGMRFTGFLLWGAAAALALSALLDRLAAWEGGPWETARRVFYGALFLGLAVFCAMEAFVVGKAGGDRAGPSPDAVVVLGAGVNGRTPSLSLRTRLEAALEYAREHPDIPIVVSGGQGYGEEIAEAQCMYDWLTERGVDPERLILEEAAASTAENFALSKPLLASAGVDVENGRVAVVSNDFHLARAELIARRRCGYGAVAGVPAKLPWLHLSVNYYIREAFGVAAVLAGVDGWLSSHTR